jgi:hypothetical protein
MIRNSTRGIRLLSWRTLRWAIALPTLPLVWWACASHPLTQPVPAPEQETNIYISVSPVRLLDLVFMIDNSPSMAPKQAKMNTNFPKLIAALNDPVTNTLPDLRVAIIDSDLGTGGAYPAGSSCGAKTLPDGTPSTFGDMGQFQMIGATACGVTSADATFLETKGNTGLNFNGDINTVFACLAGNLGTVGCGEEHQLQAFEFAFIVSNLPDPNIIAQRAAFLRPNAYLGLVFLSDEDDCSAAGDDAMFGAIPSLQGESASIRCYTRSYTCGGNFMANPPPGYPTSAPFSDKMSDCKARVGDTCGGNTDVSQPTPQCNPLRDYEQMANEIKSLKGDWTNQLLVAGIFGWPLDDKPENATYKVDLIPNPNLGDTTHPTIWDTWPVCYDPNHQPAAATTDKTTGFDATAAGWGATPGLRMSAFVDEFNTNGVTNGLKYSICQPDFSAAMAGIGAAISKHLQNLCVDYQLWKDANGQADCRVAYNRPQPDGTFQEDSVGMPECAQGQTTNVSEDCWYLSTDTTKCPVNGQLINIARSAKDIQQYGQQLPAGTKVDMQCRTCTDFRQANGDPLPGC